jgi:arylsulfatase A-like enzyme
VLVGSTALAGCEAVGPGEAEPPNIIYLLADDLGYAELGAYGQTRIRTPNLDRMAAEGMKFTQHYSGSPVCAPSRNTLLTGLHTGHTQIRDNYELGGFLDEEERGQMPLDSGTYTIGHLLKQAGYVTAAIGKWGLGGPGTSGEPNRHGFDYFFGYLDQKQAHNYYPTHLWRNGERVPLDNPYFSPHQRHEGDAADPASYDMYKGADYSLDVLVDDALRFIRENREHRFFLYVPFTIPHLALQVPDSSVADYEGAFEETPYLGDRSYLPHPKPKAAYAGMITRMDAHVGRILALLEELGLDDRTIVMFSSDNGTTYTGGVDAEFFQSVGPLRGLKGSVYEGGIRVPLIARWPGRIAPGTTTGHVSAFWDLLPTLAGLARAPAPGNIDGVTFLPTLLGRGEQPEHEWLYWEYHGLWKGAQSVRMGRWKGVRLGGHANADAPIELYDLEADIGETNDVAAQHPELVARIRAVMQSRTESRVPEWNFAR